MYAGENHFTKADLWKGANLKQKQLSCFTNGRSTIFILLFQPCLAAESLPGCLAPVEPSYLFMEPSYVAGSPVRFFFLWQGSPGLLWDSRWTWSLTPSVPCAPSGGEVLVAAMAWRSGRTMPPTAHPIRARGRIGRLGGIHSHSVLWAIADYGAMMLRHS